MTFLLHFFTIGMLLADGAPTIETVAVCILCGGWEEGLAYLSGLCCCWLAPPLQWLALVFLVWGCCTGEVSLFARELERRVSHSSFLFKGRPL